MLKLLISISFIALMAFRTPTPSVAAASDATDISARRKFGGAAPMRSARINRGAIGRGSFRANRSFAVRRHAFRGHRGATSARFAVRQGYSGRYAARAYRYGGYSTIALAGSRYGLYRTPRSIYWGGRYRSYLPLAALGAVAVGAAYYYPDAYLSVARPACQGVTPDGCRLNLANGWV